MKGGEHGLAHLRAGSLRLRSSVHPLGGRWRHGLVLESTEPEVDDVIVIEALLNSTSSVSFKLTNQ